MSKYPYKVIDRYGCGNIAFYLKHELKPGMVIMVRDVVLPDGTNPKAGNLITCGSCGKTMMHWELEKND